AVSFEGDAEETYQLVADLAGTSPTALVYVERGQTAAASIAQDVADEFDQAILGPLRSYFGTETDVDRNDRVIILLLDIRDGFTGSGGYVGGYFDPRDLFVTSGSNQGEVLYIDTNPLSPGSEDFLRTIAHEFQHLVNFAENYLYEGGQRQDTWIDEGLSLSAEYLYRGSHSTMRIDYYNADPEGSIALGNNFYDWNNGDVLADYSTAYIFFQWLRIHANNGAGIYREIIANDNNGYQAVEDAARNRIAGSDGTIDGLIRDWYIAIRYGLPSGLYGFGSDATLNGLVFHDESMEDSSIDLAPGEGVFIPTEGSLSPDPVTNIGYVGLPDDYPDTELDFTGSQYDGERVLVWNRNPVNDPEDEDYAIVAVPIAVSVGTMSGLSETSTSGGTLSGASLTASSVTGAGGAPRSYPIGVRRPDPLRDGMVRDGR
ncbi:MAG: hypothetical protein ACOCV0_02390, partial [Alkalispirochaeta sp.]